MDVRNCPRCGKLFTVLSAVICKDCEREEDDIFIKVKDYIDDHPDCQLKDVVEDLDVSMKRIVKYIKDGRIEISKGISEDIACESCGRPLSRGRFCDKCLIKIDREVKDMFDPANQKSAGPKMHHNKRL